MSAQGPSRFNKGDIVTFIPLHPLEQARTGEVIEVKELRGKAYTLVLWLSDMRMRETVLESRCILTRGAPEKREPPVICNRRLVFHCDRIEGHHGTCRPSTKT